MTLVFTTHSKADAPHLVIASPTRKFAIMKICIQLILESAIVLLKLPLPLGAPPDVIPAVAEELTLVRTSYAPVIPYN